jgi:V/A-type H+-transporting ATPase subunit I
VGVFESLVIMLGTAGLLLFLGAQGAILPAGLGGIGLYLFLAAVVVAGISLVVERDVIKRFLWLLESTSSFGHILSHARLMAFGLAAAALAKAANDLGAQLGTPGVLVAILIAAGAQALFLLFTIIGHIIQPARLHWVEFFSKFKFHEESGRAYRPFQKSAAPGR